MQTRVLYQPKRRQISLTALIDVVFILLLFFMLTTSFNQWKQVPLAVGGTASEAQSTQKPAVILITPQAGLVVYGQSQRFSHYAQVTQSALPASMQQANISVLPHHDSQMQTVIAVLQHLKGLGLHVRLGESYGDALDAESGV